MKKLTIYMGVALLMAVLTYGIRLYGNDQNLAPEQKAYLQSLTEISDDVDQDIIQNDIQDYNEDEIALPEVDQLNFAGANIDGLSLQSLERLYAQRPSNDLFGLIITQSIRHKQFDLAYEYLQEEGIQDSLEIVGIGPYMQVIFNVAELDFNRITTLKSIVEALHERNILTGDEYMYYMSLIALSRGDIENMDYFVEQLQDGGSHADWKSYVERAHRTGESYEGAPDYYVLALMGAGAYDQGRYQVSLKLGYDIQLLDSAYILPRQLIAYSHYMLGYEGTHDELTFLIENDASHVQLYTYMQGVMHYFGGDDAASVLLLQQITNTALRDRAREYMLLSYSRMQDSRKVASLIRYLKSEKTLGLPEYIQIRQQLFRSEDQQFSLQVMDVLGADVEELISECYASMSDREICLYGKAGLLHMIGDDEKAYVYLREVAKTIQYAPLYHQLGQISYDLDRSQESKIWYAYALRNAETDAQAQRYRSDFLEIVR